MFLDQLAAVGADPAPLAHQHRPPEQIPLDHERIISGDGALWLDAPEGQGFHDRREFSVEHRGWESRSGGKGVFLVVEKVIDGRDMRAQMLDKVGAAQ